MLLVLALVQNQDIDGLLDNLATRDLRATYIPTVSGLLHERSVTVMEVIEEDGQLEDVLEVIRQSCHARPHLVKPLRNSGGADDMVFLPSPVEVEVGGATVFVFDVVHFERA